MSGFTLAKLAMRRPHMSRMDSEANLPEAAVGPIHIVDIVTVQENETGIGNSWTDNAFDDNQGSSSSSSMPFPLNPRTSSRSLSNIPLDGLDSRHPDSDTESQDGDTPLTTYLPSIPSTPTPTIQIHHILPPRPEADFDHTFEPPSTPISPHPTSLKFHSPIPLPQKPLCKILRHKSIYPRYTLHLDTSSSETGPTILHARKTKPRSSYYVISTPSNKPLAVVRSNFLGTAFIISSPDHQTEYASVLYEPNLLGFKGPRKMTVIMPALSKDGKRLATTGGDKSLITRYKSTTDRNLLTLYNKAPQWNEETQSFVLNFSGRVTLASVKNFQIVHDNDLDYIILQFGRISEDTFTLDFQYPMTPIQALGIALTSFDAKLACE